MGIDRRQDLRSPVAESLLLAFHEAADSRWLFTFWPIVRVDRFNGGGFFRLRIANSRACRVSS